MSNQASGGSFKYIKSAGKFSQLPDLTQLEILKTVLDHGKFMHMVAFGMSMHPLIRDGDKLLIKPIGTLLPQIGDVVAFQRPENGHLIIHRVIGWERDLFEIKGDNVSTPDGWISKQLIIGLVASVLRSGRDVHAGLGKTKGFIAWLSKINFVVFANRIVGFYPRAWKYALRKFHIIGD